MQNKKGVQEAKDKIERLGYTVTFECTNPKKPDQVQQMFVYKKDKDKEIAKVSLILACRVNTMFNGVGKNQSELLKILTDLSLSFARK